MRDSEWDALGDGPDMEDGSQYIGMIDEDEADEYQEDMAYYGDDDGEPSMPLQEKKPETPKESFAYLDIDDCDAQIAMNQEAVQQMEKQPIKAIDDKTVRKIGPNMYAVLSPSKQRPQSMGQVAGRASSSFDYGSLVGAVGQLGVQAGQMYLQHQQSQAEAAAARQAQRVAAEEAAAARQQEWQMSQQRFRAQQQQAKREHELAMARMRQEREAMVAQGASAAQAARSIPTPAAPPILSATPPGAMPPWAWALIAVGGTAMVGGLVYAIAKK